MRTPESWYAVYIQGGWYRLKMRFAHRLGFCYPQPNIVDEHLVWCHWCGMRGKRIFPNRRAIEELIAAKSAELEGTDG